MISGKKRHGATADQGKRAIDILVSDYGQAIQPAGLPIGDRRDSPVNNLEFRGLGSRDGSPNH
jgi:hypothetical protein